MSTSIFKFEVLCRLSKN